MSTFHIIDMFITHFISIEKQFGFQTYSYSEIGGIVQSSHASGWQKEISEKCGCLSGWSTPEREFIGLFVFISQLVSQWKV